MNKWHSLTLGLNILSIVLSCVALIYFVFALILVFAINGLHIYLFDFKMLLLKGIPSFLAGFFVFSGKILGEIRGDFVIWSLLLVIISKLLKQASRLCSKYYNQLVLKC